MSAESKQANGGNAQARQSPELALSVPDRMRRLAEWLVRDQSRPHHSYEVGGVRRNAEALHGEVRAICDEMKAMAGQQDHTIDVQSVVGHLLEFERLNQPALSLPDSYTEGAAPRKAGERLPIRAERMVLMEGPGGVRKPPSPEQVIEQQKRQHEQSLIDVYLSHNRERVKQSKRAAKVLKSAARKLAAWQTLQSKDQSAQPSAVQSDLPDPPPGKMFNRHQIKILRLLKNTAMTADALRVATKLPGGNLYRRGLTELKNWGVVKNGQEYDDDDPRRRIDGYFRPDAPPPEAANLFE